MRLEAKQEIAPGSSTPGQSNLSADNPSTDNLSAEELIEQGRQYYSAQRFSAAATVWSQSADLFATQNNSIQQALALSYLTAAYQQLGQWENANNSIEQSVTLISAQSSPGNGLTPITAQVHNTLGSLRFAQGQTQSALETWQYAAALYLQIGDQQRYFNNLLNQVQAQQVLGYYHQAGQTLATLEDYLPQQTPALQIRGYQRLGQTYRLIGNLEVSETHLKTAIDLANEQGTQTGPILIELGNTLQAQGELPKAITQYQAAISQSTHPDIQLKAQLNQLQVLTQTDPAAARAAIAPLSDQLANTPPGRNRAYAYIHAAQSLTTLGSPADLETSARWLAQAIQQSIELHDSRAEAYARGYLGHVYEQSEQWAEAQTLTEAALTTAQAIRAADIAYQWQWQLGRLLKQQNKTELALQAYRDAYATLQSIQQDLVATNQDLQFSFRDSVEPVYRELVDLLLQAPDDTVVSQKENDSSAAAAKRQEARTVIESLQVAELDNFFRTACLEGQQVALEDVEKTDAAVVYPIILRDRLEILVSLPDQPLQQYTSLISQDDLEETLIEWRKNLEKPFPTPEGRDLGQRLYQWLIQPMQAVLSEANIQTLTFVLDGALRNTPMAALYTGDRYLIEDYAVALSPGLQLLGPKALQDTSSTALLAGITKDPHGLGELLNVENELQTVSNLVDSHLMLDEAFTTTSLTQQVTGSNRPIVHLATHGKFSSNVDETFILAWDRRIPVTELSALLKAGDLNRPDPIELLILSACETATGDPRAALGLAGVALQSGTRSTLASLWNLDDASGAVFVEQFYQALAQPNTTKAKALQQAQINLLRDTNYEAPTYWSAYVLVGNWL